MHIYTYALVDSDGEMVGAGTVECSDMLAAAGWFQDYCDENWHECRVSEIREW